MTEYVWLCGEYHFASLYSCRMPMSSIASARSLPSPGPATVRLACIRVGIEFFGEEQTRDNLFPIIRSMELRIQPPARVALTYQTIRNYKATSQPNGITLNEAPVQREMAHATGSLRIFVNVPLKQIDAFSTILMGVGYWGQTSGLVWCQEVQQALPNDEHCMTPLTHVDPSRQIGTLFTATTTEFRNGTVQWEELMPDHAAKHTHAIVPTVYVWPLSICERHRGGTILGHRSHG